MKKLINTLMLRLYKTESEIEKKVVDELIDWGINFETQYEVEPYRLDIAFPKYKVALEVDGNDFHTTDKQRQKDKLRDEYLEKVKGWKIERVPAYFCNRYPDLAVVKVERHISNIEKRERYRAGIRKMINWYIKDLNNRGLNIKAENIIDNYDKLINSQSTEAPAKPV